MSANFGTFDITPSHIDSLPEKPFQDYEVIFQNESITIVDMTTNEGLVCRRYLVKDPQGNFTALDERPTHMVLPYEGIELERSQKAILERISWSFVSEIVTQYMFLVAKANDKEGTNNFSESIDTEIAEVIESFRNQQGKHWELDITKVIEWIREFRAMNPDILAQTKYGVSIQGLPLAGKTTLFDHLNALMGPAFCELEKSDRPIALGPDTRAAIATGYTYAPTFIENSLNGHLPEVGFSDLSGNNLAAAYKNSIAKSLPFWVTPNQSHWKVWPAEQQLTDDVIRDLTRGIRMNMYYNALEDAGVVVNGVGGILKSLAIFCGNSKVKFDGSDDSEVVKRVMELVKLTLELNAQPEVLVYLDVTAEVQQSRMKETNEIESSRRLHSFNHSELLRPFYDYLFANLSELTSNAIQVIRVSASELEGDEARQRFINDNDLLKKPKGRQLDIVRLYESLGDIMHGTESFSEMLVLLASNNYSDLVTALNAPNAQDIKSLFLKELKSQLQRMYRDLKVEAPQGLPNEYTLQEMQSHLNDFVLNTIKENQETKIDIYSLINKRNLYRFWIENLLKITQANALEQILNEAS